MWLTGLQKFVLVSVFSLSGIATSPLLTAVGKVQNDVLTSRDVYISGWIEKTLFSSAGAKDQTLPDLNSGEFKKLLRALLLEVALAREAKTFAAVNLEPSEVKSASEVLRKELSKSQKMTELGVEFSEAVDSLRQKLMAKKFIRFKSESSMVSVTDSEAKIYFEANRLKFGDLPFENFKENIKVFLTREQVDQRLRDWFEVLHSKYQIEYYEDPQSF